MYINNKYFDLNNNTYIMGILNVTPDSFSDGGEYLKTDDALKHTERMINEGAHIIDIGGESTRPGFTPIGVDEEIDRVCAVIEKIRERFDVAISIDSYKPAVAAAAINAGAGMLNDICGLKLLKQIPTTSKPFVGEASDITAANAVVSDADKLNNAEIVKKTNYNENSEMAKLAADTGVAVCLMHNREKIDYVNYLEDVHSDLKECVEIAKAYGIKDEQICLDPGFGFAKTYEQNLELMKNIHLLDELGYPLLIGTSRKSFIGKALDTEVGDRLEGTLATTAFCMLESNSRIFRVHDVKENARIVQMINTVRNY